MGFYPRNGGSRDGSGIIRTPPSSITGKGLKIAGGIDEEQVNRQGEDIRHVNDSAEKSGLRVLRSLELNLSPTGAGNMDESCLKGLDLVLGCFHSALRRKEDRAGDGVTGLIFPRLDDY